jgi:hypothetical protein
MARFGLSKRSLIALAVLLIGAAGSVAVYGVDSPDNMVIVVPQAQVTGGAAGASLGGFAYDVVNNVFYIGIFGTPKFYRFYDANTDTSDTYVDTYNEELFMRASDVPGGLSDANETGGGLPSGLSLNPTTLVVGGITYPPGTLCFVTDGGIVVKDNGITTRQDWTKRVLRWDLRKVYAATSVLPDYANAQDGVGNIMGALGIADWNDVFTVGATEADMRAIAGGANVANVGRKGAFSSDGLSFYFTSIATDDPGLGGVWKMDAQTGAVQRIFREYGPSPNVSCISELACISTSVRDFTGGTGTGDQVVLLGTTHGGNVGGINYLLDTGAAVTGPFVLLDAARWATYLEWNGKYNPRDEKDGADPGPGSETPDTPKIYAFESSSAPDLYFYDSSSKNVWRLDAADRLACVKTMAQHARWHLANGKTSTAGSTQRLQRRTVMISGQPVTQLMFQSVDLKCIGGINAFKTGDFDRDGVRGANDIAIFKAALNTPIATFSTGTTPNRKFYEAPTDGSGNELESTDLAAYLTYLKCDLNGNTLVTEKDKEMLQRFMVDLDEDNDVDLADFSIFQGCFNGPNRIPAQANCDWADFDMDNDVDLTDFAIFQGCFNGPNRPVACQ